MRYSRDDDILDFVLSHHVRSERSSRCYQVGGRHICARCTGVAIGLAAMLLSSTMLHGIGLYFLLPIPAFLDWGGRSLGLIDLGKAVSTGTGILMGLSIPAYAEHLSVLGPDAVFSALAYLSIFILVFKGNLKGPSA